MLFPDLMNRHTQVSDPGPLGPLVYFLKTSSCLFRFLFSAESWHRFDSCFFSVPGLGYEGCSNMNASSFIPFFTYMLRQNVITFWKEFKYN